MIFNRCCTQDYSLKGVSECLESEFDWALALLSRGFSKNQVEKIKQDIVEKYGMPLIVTSYSEAGLGYSFEKGSGNHKEGKGCQYKLEIERINSPRNNNYSYVFDIN